VLLRQPYIRDNDRKPVTRRRRTAQWTRKAACSGERRTAGRRGFASGACSSSSRARRWPARPATASTRTR
jgi:hypothetical protein